LAVLDVLGDQVLQGFALLVLIFVSHRPHQAGWQRWVTADVGLDARRFVRNALVYLIADAVPPLDLTPIFGQSKQAMGFRRFSLRVLSSMRGGLASDGG
jgi:hypothetical protein